MLPLHLDPTRLEDGATSYSFSRKYAINVMANDLFLQFHAISFAAGKYNYLNIIMYIYYIFYTKIQLSFYIN